MKRTYNQAALLGGAYNDAALLGGAYNDAALLGGAYNDAALLGGAYNDAALLGGAYNDAALEGGSFPGAGFRGGFRITSLARKGRITLNKLYDLGRKISSRTIKFLPKKVIESITTLIVVDGLGERISTRNSRKKLLTVCGAVYVLDSLRLLLGKSDVRDKDSSKIIARMKEVRNLLSSYGLWRATMKMQNEFRKIMTSDYATYWNKEPYRASNELYQLPPLRIPWGKASKKKASKKKPRLPPPGDDDDDDDGSNNPLAKLLFPDDDSPPTPKSGALDDSAPPSPDLPPLAATAAAAAAAADDSVVEEATTPPLPGTNAEVDLSKNDIHEDVQEAAEAATSAVQAAAAAGASPEEQIGVAAASVGETAAQNAAEDGLGADAQSAILVNANVATRAASVAKSNGASDDQVEMAQIAAVTTYNATVEQGGDPESAMNAAMQVASVVKETAKDGANAASDASTSSEALDVGIGTAAAGLADAAGDALADAGLPPSVQETVQNAVTINVVANSIQEVEQAPIARDTRRHGKKKQSKKNEASDAPPPLPPSLDEGEAPLARDTRKHSRRERELAELAKYAGEASGARERRSVKRYGYGYGFGHRYRGGASINVGWVFGHGSISGGFLGFGGNSEQPAEPVEKKSLMGEVWQSVKNLGSSAVGAAEGYAADKILSYEGPGAARMQAAASNTLGRFYGDAVRSAVPEYLSGVGDIVEKGAKMVFANMPAIQMAMATKDYWMPVAKTVGGGIAKGISKLWNWGAKKLGMSDETREKINNAVSTTIDVGTDLTEKTIHMVQGIHQYAKGARGDLANAAISGVAAGVKLIPGAAKFSPIIDMAADKLKTNDSLLNPQPPKPGPQPGPLVMESADNSESTSLAMKPPMPVGPTQLTFKPEPKIQVRPAPSAVGSVPSIPTVERVVPNPVQDPLATKPVVISARPSVRRKGISRQLQRLASTPKTRILKVRAARKRAAPIATRRRKR